MCFSLIFYEAGSGFTYAVLYALHVAKPISFFPWKGRAEFYLVLRINNKPKETPCKVGIYFPFKTGKGTASILKGVPSTYMNEERLRENYLEDLYKRGFPSFDTIPWVQNIGDDSDSDFRATLKTLYKEDDSTNMQRFYEDVTTPMSEQQHKAWSEPDTVTFSHEERHGTIFWMLLNDERLIKTGTKIIIRITFQNAEAEYSWNRFWKASALILKYPYGYLENNLCSKSSIIPVLYYRFKILHNSSLEFEDGGRMEIRPPFMGVQDATDAEGKRFNRERNTIFLNLGKEPPVECLIAWSKRQLELILPIAGFLIGVAVGLLPFL